LKQLLLLGGGHSHVEVIRRLALEPVRGASVTLVSPDRHTPYSGMLPGFIAGHYRFDECHIDLEPLCAAAGILFRCASAGGLDPDARGVSCSDGSTLAYDLLSIDIGATPDIQAIPGALEHGIPVKPVGELLKGWASIQAGLRAGHRLSLAIVGGGAGGVELSTAMHHRLQEEASSGMVQFALLTDTESILPGHPARVRRVFERVLRERGVEVFRRAKVSSFSPGRLHFSDGGSLAVDHAIVATGASAPAWIEASGVSVDAQRFIAVNDHLQSVSHPNVFAAGDIASMINHPRPKSGVFAVRQGPILYENLRRALGCESLLRYIPQKNALALISTGSKHAVASWNGIAFEGDWVWRWKDRIDRRFMATYQRGSA
jgi:selenide,water dikinase